MKNKKYFQEKIITRHWGKEDSLDIDQYVFSGGYAALRKAIRDMERGEAIGEICRSGLRGRGGAGFLAGEKLSLVAQNTGKEKFFICNLDESEPGTWKDRSIAENSPYLLLEGITILSLLAGAKKAFIYLNGNYEKPAEVLEEALRRSRSREFLGRGIIGSAYDLEIEIFRGAGAYICGEETALIASMEGKRGEPKIRPPYPTQSGLFGCPTLVNNAETTSAIPWIISNGGEAYSKIGISDSPGTKLYCLGGAVKNEGVFEGPTGMSLKDIIENFGGGMKAGTEFWFAQVGGSSGNLILKEDLDRPLSFLGDGFVSLGSGAVLVADRNADLKKMLLSWTGFFRRESCGKCLPCREGTFRLFEIAKRFSDGEISERDKQAVKDILWTLERTTFCPLGKFASTAMRDAVEKLKVFG